MKRIMKCLMFATLFVASFGLECWECLNAKSNKACLLLGRLQKCQSYQKACQNEVRRGSFGILITKRCKEAEACDNNYIQNPRSAWYPSQCNNNAPNSVCRCCCDYNECNKPTEGCNSTKSSDIKNNFFCPVLEPPRNGKMMCFSGNSDSSIIKDQTSPGTDCFFTCNKGYVIKGSRRSTCTQQFDRTRFNNPPPSCIPMTCPIRGVALENGHVICTRNNEVFSACSFACDRGFYLEGSSSTSCLLSRSWSHSFPKCIRSQCNPSHVNPNNGSVTCSDSNNGGSSCRFECDSGFVMEGGSLSSCVESSFPSWSSEPPTCVAISCGSPPPFRSMRTTCSNGYNYGSKCLYSCASGYYMKGEAEVTCIKNVNEDATGLWSHKQGRCFALRCPHLAVPGNGTMSCRGFGRVGSRCVSTCNSGYNLIGQPASVCEQVSERRAEYNNPTPICAKVQCSPPQLRSRAEMDCSEGNNVGSVCSYSCKQGYYMKGDSKILCLDNQLNDLIGSWSTNPGRCVALRCPHLAVPGNGTMSCRGFGRVGSRCVSTCNSGYNLIGQPASVCEQVSERRAEYNNPTPICAKFRIKEYLV